MHLMNNSAAPSSEVFLSNTFESDIINEELEAQLYANIHYTSESQSTLDDSKIEPKDDTGDISMTAEKSVAENSDTTNTTMDSVNTNQTEPSQSNPNPDTTEKTNPQNTPPNCKESGAQKTKSKKSKKKNKSNPEKNSPQKPEKSPPKKAPKNEIVDLVVLSDTENEEKDDKSLIPKIDLCFDQSSTEPESDSEESIFEVPVPPKPAPLMIDLEESEKDWDEELDESLITDESMLVNSITSSHSEDSFLTNDEPSEFPERDNEILMEKERSTDFSNVSIILHCTEVQKTVSNVREIGNFNAGVEETATSSSGKKRTHDEMEGGDRSSLEISLKRRKAFYDDSWGGEEYCLKEVMSKMSKDRSRWTILQADIMRQSPRNRTQQEAKCKRCKKWGHSTKHCFEQRKTVCCYMCGVLGHKEKHCPHKMCLTCGKKQKSYRTICDNCRKLHCNICKAWGHKHDSCPDLWRRYHDTIKSDELPAPQNTMKPKHQQNCCNCTEIGHEYFNCPKYRWSQHLPTPAYVTNYQRNLQVPQGNTYSPQTFVRKNAFSPRINVKKNSFSPQTNAKQGAFSPQANAKNNVTTPQMSGKKKKKKCFAGRYFGTKFVKELL